MLHSIHISKYLEVIIHIKHVVIRVYLMSISDMHSVWINEVYYIVSPFYPVTSTFVLVTLWKTNIAMENYHFKGNFNYRLSLFIALVYQRV